MRSDRSSCYPNLSSSSPLATTTIPSSVMVNPRVRSASRLQPISKPSWGVADVLIDDLRGGPCAAAYLDVVK